MFNEKSMEQRKWDAIKNLNCKECKYNDTCIGNMIEYHCKAVQDIEFEYEREYEMMGGR